MEEAPYSKANYPNCQRIRKRRMAVNSLNRKFRKGPRSNRLMSTLDDNHYSQTYRSYNYKYSPEQIISVLKNQSPLFHRNVIYKIFGLLVWASQSCKSAVELPTLSRRIEERICLQAHTAHMLAEHNSTGTDTAEGARR